MYSSCCIRSWEGVSNGLFRFWGESAVAGPALRFEWALSFLGGAALPERTSRACWYSLYFCAGWSSAERMEGQISQIYGLTNVGIAFDIIPPGLVPIMAASPLALPSFEFCP